MSVAEIAQPDVKLVLDGTGVIREASLSGGIPTQDLANWIGRSWSETVATAGASKVENLLREARSGGVSGFRQLNQRFPDGLELPIEYTAVWLGGPPASALVIGRNLQTVADLQARLLSAQEALERDYWKMRDIQTRYRQLFDASAEAVLLVHPGDLRIIDANPAALLALGVPARRAARIAGEALLEHVAETQHDALHAAFGRAHQHGKAPGVVVALGDRREPWTVRASLIRSAGSPVLLLQLAPAARPGGAPGPAPPAEDYSVETLVRRAAEPFVVLSGDGVVRMANAAFVELLQEGSEAALVGLPLERWLAQPGTDVEVLVASVRRLGRVRRFAVTLRGALGGERRVELSACGDRDEEATYIGVVAQPAEPAAPGTAGTDLEPLVARVGSEPLRTLVGETVEIVETRIIRAALEITDGNRTAAAVLLGLSRQGLYAKLARYGLDPDSGSEQGPRPNAG